LEELTESYAAVAEVLAYVYQLKWKKMPTPPQAVEEGGTHRAALNLVN
jgi:hypothetical protein